MTGIRWLRAMPSYQLWSAKLRGRPFIWDQLPRAQVDGYDYRPAFDQLPRGGVIVDWDIAVSAEQRDAFNDLISRHPRRVIAAPYKLYPRSTSLPAVVWAHRRADGPGRWRWVDDTDADCDLAGFGCTYIPAELIGRARQEIAGKIGDDTFSLWHFNAGLGPMIIAWDIRPIHLHY